MAATGRRPNKDFQSCNRKNKGWKEVDTLEVVCRSKHLKQHQNRKWSWFVGDCRPSPTQPPPAPSASPTLHPLCRGLGLQWGEDQVPGVWTLPSHLPGSAFGSKANPTPRLLWGLARFETPGLFLSSLWFFTPSAPSPLVCFWRGAVLFQQRQLCLLAQAVFWTPHWQR